MGWAAKKRIGRPADEAGPHPSGPKRSGGKRAWRALRPGAAGLKRSVAYPTDGERTNQAIGPAQPWPDLRRQQGKRTRQRVHRSRSDPAAPPQRRAPRRTLATTGRRGGVRAGLGASRRCALRAERACYAGNDSARTLSASQKSVRVRSVDRRVRSGAL